MQVVVRDNNIDQALKALKNVFRDNAYASQALDRELSAAKLSDDDRRLAASMFYFTLENRLRIQSLISTKVQSRPDPEIMDILTLAAAQILFMDKIPDHAAVDEAVKQVRAYRGKVARAEPVAALYEQGRVSHIGPMPELEDQMALMGPGGFVGEGSPDRLDAAVWALTELILTSGGQVGRMEVRY